MYTIHKKGAINRWLFAVVAILTGFAGFLINLHSAHAAVNNYYVSVNSGSDSNSGLQGSPWRTISHAIATASLTGGTTIHVAAGTYTENISCGTRSAAICINRSGPSITQRLRVQCDTQWSVPSGAGCLVRSSAETMSQITGNNVDIVGFDYSNPNSGAGIVPFCNISSGNCPNGNSVHIINNYLHDIGQNVNDSLGGPGCPSFGAIFVGSQVHASAYQTDIQIIGNRIFNYGNQSKMRYRGGNCNFAQAIYADTAGVIIEDNVIIQGGTFGIQFYSQPCNVHVKPKKSQPELVFSSDDSPRLKCAPFGRCDTARDLSSGCRINMDSFEPLERQFRIAVCS